MVKKLFVYFLIIIFCLMSKNAFAVQRYEIRNAGCSAIGNSIFAEPNNIAILPVLFATELRYSYDSNQNDNNTLVFVEKISFMGFLAGQVRPYIKIGGERYNWESEGEQTDVETEKNTVYGVGIDAIIKQWDTVSLFGSIGYTYGQYKYKKYKVAGVDMLEPASRERIGIFNTALGLGKKLEINGKTLIPYFGIVYFYGEGKWLDNNPGTMDKKDKLSQVGPFAGLTYQLSQNMSFNLEGSYIDSNLGVSGTIAVQF